MPSWPSSHKALPRAAHRFEAPETRRLTAQVRGYNSRWQAARLAFLAKHPLCVMCQAEGRVTAATVVDHIVPHRLGGAIESGDAHQIHMARARFWDSSNWQPLCKPHHDGTKQAIERRSAPG